MKTMPCGAWPSPISPDSIVAESVRLGDVALDGDDAYWVEGRPAEKGRQALVRRDGSGHIEDALPSGFSVRTRVHEYGGTAFAVSGGIIWFSNDADGRLYRHDSGHRDGSSGGEPTPVTPDDGARYGEPVIDRAGAWVYCIRERSVEGGEPINDLVRVGADGSVAVIASGNDFYATPRPAPDGRRVAWISWNHPDMPWDGTTLQVAELDGEGNVSSTRIVAGGADESVVQPEWSADGVLHFVSDQDGWWNLYRLDAEVTGETSATCLYAAEAEFGKPHWVFGLTTWGFMHDGRIACSYGREGVWHLAVLDPKVGALNDVQTPFTSFEHVRVAGHHLLCVAGAPDRASAVVRFELPSGTFSTLCVSSSLDIPDAWLSRPASIHFDSDGASVHAFHYAPRNPEVRAPDGELPPLIVIGHGGPTSATAAVLDARIQYWTTRGFAVVDVNYRGSTGFGRAYRDALKGGWGVVDVLDCVNAARHLADAGKADARRLIIRGGSAGGFTALAALCFHDVFAAAASYYGISELESLAADTHKFESRYLDSLIGPWPQDRDTYRARSPIHHVDALRCPVIFFQGLEDRVVPPNQAEMMVDALRAKGIAVEYHAFEGEQHGFRQADTIRQTLIRELAFYGQVLGFEPV